MAKRIGELLPAVVRKARAKSRAIQQLQRSWGRLVGKTLAAHTQPASLRHGRLYVHTNQPGASFVLSLEKPRLLEKIQAGLRRGRTGQTVEEIIVRAGGPA